MSKEHGIASSESFGNASAHESELDVPALEATLHASSEDQIDGHLGPGLRFQLGANREMSVELYPQVVRVRLPHAQLVVPRRDVEVTDEGVVFQDPAHFRLLVRPDGGVLFQSSPTSTNHEDEISQWSLPAPLALPPLPSAPASSELQGPSIPPPMARPEPKERVQSERYVGRLGEVKAHHTKRGKLVAEVEMTVADPDHPGASLLLKFVAFGEKAEALQRAYRPGQEVTAVGIPHNLQRKDRNGREWTERQLYLVQLPKVRSTP